MQVSSSNEERCYSAPTLSSDRTVVAHPTVVIERPLLSVTLSDSGEFGVQEIPWGTVVNRAEKFGMWGQSVDIVSFDGLEEYLQHQDELKVNLMKYAIGRMF